jgi:isoleucyl-tRNA synthetase
MAMSKYDFGIVEKTILAFWKDKNIYEKAKKQGKGGKKFYFLDGPPYTSGKLHIAHAWNKSMKDMVLRYKRMTGHNVWDRAGYDMHGLPTEHKVVAKLNLEKKEDIIKFGLAKFIEECKKFCTENALQMNEDFKRLGVWMDFDNAYMPISPTFIEGVWWLIKKANDNGRLYEGQKVMTWCPSCATAVAKHELTYEEVTDKSIFVKFKVKGKDNEYLIIWTTTPWTIPFNLAVMVNPELDYVRAKVENEIWIVSKALSGPVIQAVAGKRFEIIEEFKGKQLEYLHYEHPFYDTLKQQYDAIAKQTDKLHSVVMSSEYVDTTAGTGLVHSAPGCGPEDYEVGKREGIPPFNAIDEYGNFPAEMGEFAGFNAKKDNDKFIQALEKRGVLIATTDVEHEYAHCWRCNNPVVFRTTVQWFFKVEDLKDEMIELNKKVHWVPNWAGSRQFDSWLKNLKDNSITRQRFWGTPIPIWRCEKCKDYVVIGSLDELEELAGKVPADLHRPWIDEVKIKCKCGGVKERIPDILDVWIDAGTNSWTCLDFPSNTKQFNELWPADFILEGADQIRGWFNMLLVASMVSFGKHPYKACYMHGLLTDIEGRKMSKSLGNIISPYEVVDKYGADTLRYYMIGATEAGVEINFSWEEAELKYKNLFVLWNIQNFLIDLCNTNKINPHKLGTLEEDMFSVEEKYLVSRVNHCLFKVTNYMELYEVDKLPKLLEDLYLDMSRTYIQLIRDKAAIGEKEDKEVVAYCLYKSMMTFLKMFSLVSPFISEMIYQNFRDAFGLKDESITLFSWPKHDDKAINKELEVEMELAKDMMQAVFFARDKSGIGRKWPLKEVIIVTKDQNAVLAAEKLQDLIKQQTNIKSVSVMETFPFEEVKAKPDFEKIAPEFKQLTPQVLAKLAVDSSETILGHINKEGSFSFSIGDKRISIQMKHLLIETIIKGPYVGSEFSKGKVYINTERSKELEAEGYAREVMRMVQNERKNAGLERKDKIVIFVKVGSELELMLKPWEDKIQEKVGASGIVISHLDPARKHTFGSKAKIKDYGIEIYFDKE